MHLPSSPPYQVPIDSLHIYSPTSVVDDLPHDTANVTVALGIVERAELGRGLVVLGVRNENATGLTLVPDNATHLCKAVSRGANERVRRRFPNEYIRAALRTLSCT